MKIYAAEFIKKAYSYIKFAGYEKETTTDYILNNWNLIEPTKEDLTEFITWVDSKKNATEYFENLFGIINRNDELVNRWQFNTLASGLNVFFKNKKAQAERDANPSTFQGEIGGKVTFTVKEYKAISYGIYGSTYWRLVGTDNNIYMWSTASYFEVGDTIVGKVKDHRDYKGEKQTIITHGKVIDREPSVDNVSQDIVNTIENNDNINDNIEDVDYDLYES